MASGPMDVEDSIQGKNPQISAESVVSNPEIAAGGGTGAEEVSGTGDGSASSPPPPQIDVAAATSNGAPEENAESARPAIPEVPLVPMPPNFDLDAYISRYSGYTKIRRLDWISQRCTELAPDCYRTALSLLRHGINTAAYREMYARARQLLGPEYEEDTEWIEQVDRRYQQSVDRLDAELNSFKTNLIKESIRVGYNELGDLSYRRGDLKMALKCYARTRDYCTTNRHSAEMCLHVIEISADMRNFVHVNNYVLKAEHTPDLEPLVVAKLRAAAGLVFLEAAEYAKARAQARAEANPLVACRQAARKFVEVSPKLGSSFDSVLAPEDIAVYGGLCALATFSRDEMKRKVLENPSFKNFLDLVPQMRELMNDFAHSRYKSCFTYLANMKGDLQLDLYLHAHLEILYKMVEDKCLMQYFSPFTSVRLVSMAEAFGMEVREVEGKVAALIMSKQISARIDSTRQTVHAKHTDQRSVSCRKMLEMGDEYRRELRAMLVRMSCVEHDFVVRANPRPLASMPDAPTGSGAMGGGAAAAGGPSGLLSDPAGVALGTVGEETRGGGDGSSAGASAGAGASTSGGASAGASGGGTSSSAGNTRLREDLDSAGGGDAERPPEAGGGSSSMPVATADAMDTVS